MLKRTVATLLTTALLGSLGSSVLAQVQPRNPVVDARGITIGGITVTASGSSSGVADTARLTLQIRTRSNVATLDAQALKPVADALIRAHADPNTVAVPFYLGEAKTNYVSISGTFDHPTEQTVRNGMITMAQAFMGLPDLIVQRAYVVVSIDDCARLRSRARGLALQHAHAQAADLARQGGVLLGHLIAVNAFADNGGPAPGNPPNACGTNYELGPGTDPQYTSVADYLQVRVYTSLSATYAIR